MIDRPTVTSAAATTMMKKTNNWPSMPAVLPAGLRASALAACILENATSNRLTALSMSSMHMKMMMTLRRVNTPIMPMQNRTSDSVM